MPPCPAGPPRPSWPNSCARSRSPCAIGLEPGHAARPVPRTLMPTKRGWAAVAAGVGFWISSLFVGTKDLHMIAAGILVLPILAALFVQWNRVRLSIHRNLSSARVYQGSRVSASLTVENEGASTAPFLLIEDALPSSLGKAARLVVTGIPPGSKQTMSYSVVARYRGRYTIGPLSIYIIDPFGLARVRIQ